MKRILLMFVFVMLATAMQPVFAQDQPGTIKYPTQLDSPDSLFRVKDKAQSTLTLGITASSTTLAVLDGSSFPASGSSLVIDNEIIYYTSRAGNSFSGLTRGAASTAAASHSSGAQVRSPILAVHRETLTSVILAIETKLGVGATIDPLKIGTGTVNSTKWGYLTNLSGDVQGQLDGKASSSHTHAAADVTSGTFSDSRIGSASTWNAKENALTFSAPLSRSLNAISMPPADATRSGYLTLADWSIFNGKQNALGYTPLNAASNLSDLGNAGTARGNLGLGTAATKNVAVSGNAASGEVVQGNDTRLSDARTPTSHTHTLSQVTDAGTAAALNVPASGNAAAGEVVKGSDTRLTDARTPTTHTHLASQVTDFDAAADARIAAAIGGSVEAYDADLAAIAALSPANNDVIQRIGGVWVNRTPTQLKTSLAITSGDVSGLGALATVSPTGTPDGTKYLRDDYSWQTVPPAYSDEQARDAVGAMFLTTAPYTWTHDDAGNTISLTIAPATTSVPGLMSAADKTKLDGVAAGATANSSDATLLARANHTGTQAISTVTNLQTSLDAKADTASVQAASYNSCADAGSNDTYVCSLSPAPASISTGQVIWFKANTSNTGAATLNLNALGAHTIKKQKDVDLADNDIKAGQWVEVQYDGSFFQMLSPISNSPSGAISGLTTNAIPKATSGTNIGDSRISDSGTVITIGTTGAGNAIQLNDSTPSIVIGDPLTSVNGTKLSINDTLQTIAIGKSSTGVSIPGTTALGVATTTTGTVTQTSNSATAFESGPNGGTNPVFRLVNSTASQADGVSVTGLAAGNGTTFTALSSGSNSGFNFTPKGTGRFVLNGAASTNVFVWQQGGTDIGALSTLNGLVLVNGRSSYWYDGGSLASPSNVRVRVNPATNGGLWLASDGCFGMASGASATAIDTSICRNAAGVIEVNNGTAGTFRDLKVRQHYVDQTITTAGTTGNVTINKAAGTANVAASASSLVVTNSLVTTNSTIHAMARTNDSTCSVKSVVPAAGSFTINMTASCTAETSVGFLVVN
jgi:tail-like repeat protein